MYINVDIAFSFQMFNSCMRLLDRCVREEEEGCPSFVYQKMEWLSTFCGPRKHWYIKVDYKILILMSTIVTRECGSNCHSSPTRHWWSLSKKFLGLQWQLSLSVEVLACHCKCVHSLWQCNQGNTVFETITYQRHFPFELLPFWNSLPFALVSVGHLFPPERNDKVL